MSPPDPGPTGRRPRHRASLLALWWGPSAATVLLVGAWVVGIPRSGEGGYWETLSQGVLLAIYAAAAVAARWWPITSATVMTVAAFAIGALSALTWPPWVGLLLSLALWFPAGLHWQLWRMERSRWAVAALAALLATCIVAAGVAGTAIYDYIQGAQTPQSIRPPYADDTGVRWLWSSAVTPTSFTVVARLDDGQGRARVVYGTTPDLGPQSSRTAWVTADEQTSGARVVVDGLRPSTRYHYAVETDAGVDRGRQGTLITFPDGSSSVTIAFASCARSGSNAAVFETIREADPDLFLMTGDLHYADIARDDVDLYVRAYDRQLTAGAPQALYLSTPVTYIWDDHDYGPDNADRTTRSRPAALASYRSLAAHYPLALPDADDPVAQAFSVGRIRVIVTDLRSARDPSDAPDGPAKSMLGQRQREWFLDELVRSSRTHAAVVWVSSVPWIVGSGTPGDSWGAYAFERRRIADVIAKEGIDNLVMVSGDAHMVAADDGSHSDYSSLGTAGFPVLHAAALDRQGSLRGGPYSQGAHPGAGQFGLLRLDDTGGASVGLSYEGRSWDGQVLVSLETELGDR